MQIVCQQLGAPERIHLIAQFAPIRSDLSPDDNFYAIMGALLSWLERHFCQMLDSEGAIGNRNRPMNDRDFHFLNAFFAHRLWDGLDVQDLLLQLHGDDTQYLEV